MKRTKEDVCYPWFFALKKNSERSIFVQRERSRQRTSMTQRRFIYFERLLNHPLCYGKCTQKNCKKNERKKEKVRQVERKK